MIHMSSYCGITWELDWLRHVCCNINPYCKVMICMVYTHYNVKDVCECICKLPNVIEFHMTAVFSIHPTLWGLSFLFILGLAPQSSGQLVDWNPMYPAKPSNSQNLHFLLCQPQVNSNQQCCGQCYHMMSVYFLSYNIVIHYNVCRNRRWNTCIYVRCISDILSSPTLSPAKSSMSTSRSMPIAPSSCSWSLPARFRFLLFCGFGFAVLFSDALCAVATHLASCETLSAIAIWSWWACGSCT